MMLLVVCAIAITMAAARPSFKQADVLKHASAPLVSDLGDGYKSLIQNFVHSDEHGFINLTYYGEKNNNSYDPSRDLSVSDVMCLAVHGDNVVILSYETEADRQQALTESIMPGNVLFLAQEWGCSQSYLRMDRVESADYGQQFVVTITTSKASVLDIYRKVSYNLHSNHSSLTNNSMFKDLESDGGIFSNDDSSHSSQNTDLTGTDDDTSSEAHYNNLCCDGAQVHGSYTAQGGLFSAGVVYTPEISITMEFDTFEDPLDPIKVFRVSVTGPYTITAGIDGTFTQQYKSAITTFFTQTFPVPGLEEVDVWATFAATIQFEIEFQAQADLTLTASGILSFMGQYKNKHGFAANESHTLTFTPTIDPVQVTITAGVIVTPLVQVTAAFDLASANFSVPFVLSATATASSSNPEDICLVLDLSYSAGMKATIGYSPIDLDKNWSKLFVPSTSLWSHSYLDCPASAAPEEHPLLE